MPVTAQQEWIYWDTKATELRRDQLTAVQTSAAKWNALMGALLGVFGTVAFAGGLATLDKLDSPWSALAKSATTVAAASAVVAIVLLTRAAGGLRLTTRRGLDATSVKELYTTNTEQALDDLRLGRRFAVVAALVVLAGSTIVLWAGEKNSSPSAPSVVAVVGGNSICGKLSSADGKLRVGPTDLIDVSAIVVVPACPS